MAKPQATGSRSRQQQKQAAKKLERRSRSGQGDNYRRYQVVHAALKQFYPGEPQGNMARPLHTLAWLVSGIVGSQRTNYRAIAKKAPDGTKVESRIKRYSRWVNNERVDFQTYFAPMPACCWTAWRTGPWPW